MTTPYESELARFADTALVDPVQQREIYDLIVSGDAFVNPVEIAIGDAMMTVSNQITEINSLASITDPNGIDNWTQSDLVTLAVDLGNLNDALSDLLTHTDRISGVTLNFQSQLPTFFTLISIWTSLADIQQQINDAGGNETLDPSIAFFASLTFFPEYLEENIAFLEDFDQKIQLIDPYDDPEFVQPLPTETQDDIEEIIQTINDFITSENNAFNTAINTITRWSMAGAMAAPSEAWRDFVVDVVASDELADLVGEIE